MPVVTPEKERYYLNQIRRLLAVRSNVTHKDVAEALGIDPAYAGKLIKKALNEASEDLEQHKIKDHVAQTRLKLDLMNDELFNIIMVKPKYDEEGKLLNKEELVSARDRMLAMTGVRQNEETLFKVLFDSGIFTRKLGEQQTSLTGLIFNVSDFVKYLLENVDGDAKRKLIDAIGEFIRIKREAQPTALGESTDNTVEE